MFSQVYVCPQEGGVPGPKGVPGSGGGSAPRGVPGPGGVGIPTCTEADTPQGVPGPGGSTPRADPPPGEMATAADGTYPTGMHSCLNSLFPQVLSV